MAVQEYDKVLLLGHSYGAVQVINLAGKHPDRIAGVVSLGIGWPAPPGMDQPGIE